MRAALAELNISPSQQNDQNTTANKQYGLDILMSDEGLSGASGGDDLWDYISDEPDDDEGDYSSDYVGGEVVYGVEWLREKCEEFSGGKAELHAGELEEQVLALLSSGGDGMFCLCVLLP